MQVDLSMKIDYRYDKTKYIDSWSPLLSFHIKTSLHNNKYKRNNNSTIPHPILNHSDSAENEVQFSQVEFIDAYAELDLEEEVRDESG